MIIITTIWNLIYAPFQFAYLSTGNPHVMIDILERTIDVLFIFDVILNFRTVFKKPMTGELVTDPKKIAYHYIFSMNFWIDLVASFPIEIILLFTGESRTETRFIRLLKLTKLFRFGKLLSYITRK